MMVIPFLAATWRISRARYTHVRYRIFSKLIEHAYSLWDTLSNDRNGSDLWVLHQFHGRLVDGSRRSEVDNGIYIDMLGHCLLNRLVDWEESFGSSPVHLGHELTTEGVDDTSNGWGGTLADEVEIQHSLDSSWLETIDETSGLVVEESSLRVWTQRSAWSRKTTDVVIGIASGGWREAAAVGGGRRAHFELFEDVWRSNGSQRVFFEPQLSRWEFTSELRE